jgi:hypothetical protein
MKNSKSLKITVQDVLIGLLCVLFLASIFLLNSIGTKCILACLVYAVLYMRYN